MSYSLSDVSQIMTFSGVNSTSSKASIHYGMMCYTRGLDYQPSCAEHLWEKKYTYRYTLSFLDSEKMQLIEINLFPKHKFGQSLPQERLVVVTIFWFSGYIFCKQFTSKHSKSTQTVHLIGIFVELTRNWRFVLHDVARNLGILTQFSLKSFSFMIFDVFPIW